MDSLSHVQSVSPGKISHLLLNIVEPIKNHFLVNLDVLHI
jgi:hypothetical protein